MNQEKLKSAIIDLYYGEADLSLREIAIRHGVELEVCQRELKSIVLVSQTFQNMPQYVPSQMSINKIMAHARDRVGCSAPRSFWSIFYHPAFSMAIVLMVAGVAYFGWIKNHDQSASVLMAQTNTATTPIENTLDIKERLFKTPLDYSRFSKSYNFRSGDNKYFYPNVTDVNMGGQPSSYTLDDGLDQKMLVKNMPLRDLETLYFRARKLEKQGFYQEALHDYIFLSENHPSFEYQKALPLAIVRCYEELGHKDTALSVLLDYEKKYGGSEDVEFWKDQLKSETF